MGGVVWEWEWVWVCRALNLRTSHETGKAPAPASLDLFLASSLSHPFETNALGRFSLTYTIPHISHAH